MKLLFIARHVTYYRNYDSVLRELAERGHRIHLAVEQDDKAGGRRAVEQLMVECPAITCGFVPERRSDTWSGVARRLRLGLDYLRYLDPFYDAAPLRRERARLRTPRLLTALAQPPLLRGRWWRRAYGRWIHALDQAVPPPEAVVDYVRQQAPDAIVITPLVDLGSQQIDYVRAARLLRIPCGLAVWSWDHLTSKALLREYPERIFVWNDTQRREAVETHGAPADRVVVTGAQCFDHWFGRRPSRSRGELCQALGLHHDRPIVLYVCSSLIKGSPAEADFVTEWLHWLRGSGDPLLASANVLVRPHPQQHPPVQPAQYASLGPVAVWGANPIDETTRADYFDSLYHSAAVVGLNTSAFIEAAIVGREVLAVIAPRFHDNQEGTEHFRYLLQIGGGLLRVARDRDTHLQQLGAALRRLPSAGHSHRAFLESFVRPQGLGQEATPVLVRAIEELPACRVDEPVVAVRWRRAVLGAALRGVSRMLGDSLVRSPRELDPERLARIARAEQKDSA
jgi:hypothetical protein